HDKTGQRRQGRRAPGEPFSGRGRKIEFHRISPFGTLVVSGHITEFGVTFHPVQAVRILVRACPVFPESLEMLYLFVYRASYPKTGPHFS
ncbi:hypothetical protein LNK15_13345, partial [Jeotgalicoccus huakuii]|nr:hypothetical protein [Jeotgalicoccus huakuii]